MKDNILLHIYETIRNIDDKLYNETKILDYKILISKM